MTEAEWLACTDPATMLDFLGKDCSKRKLRLFIADAAKMLGAILGEQVEEVAEMHERVADGEATEEDLERLLLRDMPDLWEHRPPGGSLSPVWQTAKTAVHDRLSHAPLTASAKENAVMCGVLRCLFGNPFRLVAVEPARRSSVVVTLAQEIYDTRAFDRMPELAEALEAAGCTSAEIMEHCRRDGEHVRGCWVVDDVLGKL